MKTCIAVQKISKFSTALNWRANTMCVNVSLEATWTQLLQHPLPQPQLSPGEVYNFHGTGGNWKIMISVCK